MLPPVRIAVSSSSAASRALLASGLRAAQLGPEDGAEQGFAPAWPFATVDVPAALWAADDFDLLALDEELWRCLQHHGRCELRLTACAGERERLAESALQVALRFQRFETATNAASAKPLFRQVMAAHERLHDRRHPLAAADHDHALDTWRWLLRLEPRASLAAQLAALFHDVQRPGRDAEARAGHESARVVVALLESLRASGATIERTRALVAAHESGRAEIQDDLAAEVALLANADALSFFSLNAPGFAKYYGAGHTARKVAHTAAQLDGTGRAWLSRLKLPGSVRALLRHAPTQHEAA